MLDPLRLIRNPRRGVSREEVEWCYRTFLRREPESEAAVQSHLGNRSLRGLVQAFVDSPEYEALHAQAQRPTESHALPGAAAPPPARAVAASAEHRDRRSEQPAAADEIVPTIISREAFERAIASHRTTNPLPAGQAAYIEMHLQRLLDTLNLMQPLLPQAGSIVDFSATGFFRDAVAQLLEPGRHVDVADVNFELDDYAERFGIGTFDLCLNTEVIEHLLFDPSQMLHSINRMLKPGGHLILSTPNAVSLGNVLRILTGNPPTLWNQLNAASRRYYDRHNRDWTPFETTRLLREHGFEVTRVLTRDYYEDTRRLLAQHAELALWARAHSTHAHHGDTQFVIGRKTRESEGPVRLSWLYYDAGGPVAEPVRHGA